MSLAKFRALPGILSRRLFADLKKLPSSSSFVETFSTTVIEVKDVNRHRAVMSVFAVVFQRVMDRAQSSFPIYALNLLIVSAEAISSVLFLIRTSLSVRGNVGNP